VITTVNGKTIEVDWDGIWEYTDNHYDTEVVLKISRYDDDGLVYFIGEVDNEEYCCGRLTNYTQNDIRALNAGLKLGLSHNMAPPDYMIQGLTPKGSE